LLLIFGHSIILTDMRTFFNFIVTNNPARNSPKENSGASGGFLPNPLLFHLRHPNSKTNQPKFCEILSPKNSFAKTLSALKPRHTARILGGQNPKKKNVLSFLEEIGRAQIRKAENIFLRDTRAERAVVGRFIQRF